MSKRVKASIGEKLQPRTKAPDLSVSIHSVTATTPVIRVVQKEKVHG